MKSKIYSLFLILALMGCVSEFNANIPAFETEILVVEGHIVANSTVDFYFSKSFGLDEDSPPIGYDDISVNLVIVGDDGYRSSPATNMGSGVHRIDIGTLDLNTAYAIEFQYEGDTYQSAFSKPLKTPAIDELTWVQPETYGDISIWVSTFDDDSAEASYYLWDFMEEWEITVKYYTRVFFEPYADPPYFHYNELAPLFYCWKNSKNQEILVGTTEGLKDKRIINKKLFSKEANSDRFTYLYRMTVQQQAISKAAYEYYLDKLKTSTGMGGLFSPQPSKIEGNITCITDRDKKVIGFVDVANNIAKSSLLISTSELSIRTVIEDCDDQEFDVRVYPNTPGEWEPYIVLYNNGYRPVGYSFLNGEIFGQQWAKARCADCTAKNGHKKKPEDWPNDHQ